MQNNYPKTHLIIEEKYTEGESYFILSLRVTFPLRELQKISARSVIFCACCELEAIYGECLTVFVNNRAIPQQGYLVENEGFHNRKLAGCDSAIKYKITKNLYAEGLIANRDLYYFLHTGLTFLIEKYNAQNYDDFQAVYDAIEETKDGKRR